MIVCLLQCDSCQARGQIVFSGVSSCTSASTSPSSFRPLKFHTHRQQKMCRILPPPQQPNMSGSLSHHTLWMATPQVLLLHATLLTHDSRVLCPNSLHYSPLLITPAPAPNDNEACPSPLLLGFQFKTSV